VVYNVLGQEVIRLVDKDQTPGFYALRWDGKDSFGRGVASGVYLYKIQANGETQKFSQIHKMLLLK
jgi:flagellar hook assembly protein FlgD